MPSSPKSYKKFPDTLEEPYPEHVRATLADGGLTKSTDWWSGEWKSHEGDIIIVTQIIRDLAGGTLLEV